MITVVDYKAGNLASVQKALAQLGYESRLAESPEEVLRAERIVLPGVGHFATTARLDQSGMKAAIAQATRQGVPFLGICLGMQWLFQSSAEASDVAGLGAFDGSCERFDPNVKSPHVGWNSVMRCSESRLLSGVADGAFVYFTHSYRAPVVDGVVAVAEHGGQFAAAVERDNVFGVQFHPEKSGSVGLKILRNFCEATC